MKLICLLLVSSFFQSPTAFAAEPIYGLFMVVKGDIKVTNLQNQTNPCKVGTKVFPGETIVSGVDSRAKIVMSDRNVINLSPSTTVKIDKYETDEKTGTRNVELNLIDGKVRNNVEQKYDGEKSKFLMKTPTAVAGVRGTQFVTTFDRTTRITQIVTLRGAVTLAAVNAQGIPTGKPVVVQKGEMTTMAPGGSAPEPPKKVPAEDLKKMDKESSAQTGGSGKDSSKQASNSEPRGPAGEKTDKSMINKEDMAPGALPQIQQDTDFVKPPPPPLPPPPPSSLINDIVRNKLNKTKVIIVPVPQ